MAYQARGAMTPNPPAYVPYMQARFLSDRYDSPALDLPHIEDTIPTYHDILELTVRLDKTTFYADLPGGTPTSHVMPLPAITEHEYRITHESLALGVTVFSTLQYLFPLAPNRGARIPFEDRHLESHIETQYVIDDVRTQPEYVMHQLSWDHVLEHPNIPRDWNACLRAQGTDGGLLKLNRVNAYRTPNHLIPESDRDTAQSTRYWTRLYDDGAVFAKVAPVYPTIADARPRKSIKPCQHASRIGDNGIALSKVALPLNL